MGLLHLLRNSSPDRFPAARHSGCRCPGVSSMTRGVGTTLDLAIGPRPGVGRPTGGPLQSVPHLRPYGKVVARRQSVGPLCCVSVRVSRVSGYRTVSAFSARMVRCSLGVAVLLLLRTGGYF